MFSRAHLLIEQELDNIQMEQPWGVEVWPLCDDSLFELVAKIKGLRATPWEGGIFKVYIKFDEHFNVRPPKVFFQTIPFHPNVEVNTGKPSIEFLDNYEKWNEKYTLSSILTYLQSLLANPDLETAVNPDAAQMLQSSPRSYHQMVVECVSASQRVEVGGSPHLATSDSKVRFATQPRDGMRTAPTRTGNNKIMKLSFDDYHTTWCGIGTSKTNPSDKNPLLEAIRDNEKLQEIHLGLPREEIEEQIRKQMEDHNTLMYGRIKRKPGMETARKLKLAQLERMKKIYLPPRQSPVPPTQRINLEPALPALQGKEDTKDVWEKDVDDLVQWTNNLDSDAIDAS